MTSSPVRLTLNCDEFGNFSAEPIDDVVQQEESCQTAFSEDCMCEHDFDNAVPSTIEKRRCCSNTTTLASMLTLTISFALCELVFGFVNNSLAMIADSFHMASDSAALVVAIVAIRLAQRPETDDNLQTFGWKRAEIIGALINGVYLASVCIYILFEAVFKIVKPEEMENPWQIFFVGVGGLVVNIIGVALFFSHRSLSLHAHSHGHADQHLNDSHADHHADASHGKSANMHGVFLHIVGDAVGSLIVIATALVTIYVPYWWRIYVDPVCSILFALIILKSSIPLVIHSSKILMQFAPSRESLQNIRLEILAIEGVVQIHELHVWQLTSTYCVATVHVVVENLQQKTIVEQSCNKIFCKYGIHRTTVQIE